MGACRKWLLEESECCNVLCMHAHARVVHTPGLCTRQGCAYLHRSIFAVKSIILILLFYFRGGGGGERREVVTKLLRSVKIINNVGWPLM